VRRRQLNILYTALILFAAFTCVYASAPADALFVVKTLKGDALSISAEQWKAFPRVSVTTVEHGGDKATFEGVAVAEVLRRADAPLGGALRGESLRVYVVAHAIDGYAVVFALPEFDPAFSDRQILIADRRNGEALGPEEGPLRLVVPGDKRQARWLRKLESITIGSAP
jgi:hypothetical protein